MNCGDKRPTSIRVEFWWAIHNIVVHPLYQLMWWASMLTGAERFALWAEMLHDWSVPS